MRERAEPGPAGLSIAVTCVAIALAGPAMADDPLEAVWRAHAASLRTMDVRMSIKIPQAEGTRDVAVIFDAETGRLVGTVVQRLADGPTSDRIFESTFGRSSETEWRADRMPSGHRRFNIGLRQESDDADSTHAELGLPTLLRAFEPDHLAYLDDGDVEIVMQARGPSPAAPTAERIEYLVEKDGQAAQVIYDVVFDGGVRIYRAEVRIGGRTHSLLENGDFRRSGGIWFPTRSRLSITAGGAGSDAAVPAMRAAALFEISEVTLNRSHEEAVFLPSPAPGDEVNDNVMGGYQYRVHDGPDAREVDSALSIESSVPQAWTAEPGTAAQGLPAASALDVPVAPAAERPTDRGVGRPLAILLAVTALVFTGFWIIARRRRVGKGAV